MFEESNRHTVLMEISVFASVLGALGLTIGVFMHYGSEDHVYLTCGFCGGGSLSLLLGIAVGNYKKWRLRR